MKKAHLIFALLVLALVCVSSAAVATANEAVHFAGDFSGRFFYDNGCYGDFKGILYQNNSAIWGDCTDEEGESTLTGSVSGNSITFIKTYRKDGHRVQYSGDLIPETNTVKGYWRIDQNNIGTFTMVIRGNRM